MTASQKLKAAPNTRGALVLTSLAALVSALSVADPAALSALAEYGVPELAARLTLHALPVALVAIALTAGRFVMRGWPQVFRWAGYGLLGAGVGYASAYCVIAFGGVMGFLTRFTGPLGEAETPEIVLWSLTALFVFYALMVGAIAAFGRPAISALQVEEVDPEMLDVRKHERGLMGWSAVGLLMLGVACAGIAFARQSDEAARMAPVILAIVSGAICAMISWRLWSAFDEFQRRQVVDGYAASGIVMTLGAFLWACGEALGYLPALDSAVVFIVLTLVQVTATSYAAAIAAGGKEGGKAA